MSGRGLAWALLGLAALAVSARAERTPSPELSFRVRLSPDSITVGDPIAVVLEATAPSGATLGLPQLVDSIGPFSVLSADAPATQLKDGKLSVRQQGRVTLFRPGEFAFPELELIWVRAPGETLAAYSRPVTVRVGSVLGKDEADLSKLRGVKGVVPLGRVRWWWWAALALFVAALAFLLWRNRHLWRRKARIFPAAPAPPPLPPEIAFERGLAALRKRELPERGLVKEFYAELSLLFRRYLEDQYGFPAVEETRPEVLAAAARVPEIEAAERAALADWLEEGDLVKFAKLERLTAEASGYSERAREWVARSATKRNAATAATPPEATPAPAGSPKTVLTPVEEKRP